MPLTNSLPLPTVSTTTVTAGANISATTANISSSNVVLASNDVTIYDNILLLNTDETGAGITKSPELGGFEIGRGSLPNYRMVFSEATQGLTTGFVGSTMYNNASVAPTATDGILGWNGTHLDNATGLTSTQVGYVNNMNQNVSTTSSPTFTNITLNGNQLQFPSNTGSSNEALTTDGNGHLSWTTVATGGSSSFISSTNSNITCANNIITTTINSADAMVIDSTSVELSKDLVLSAGLYFTTNTITSNTYTIASTDVFVIWNGTASGTITLPVANSIISGRVLYIQNISSNNVTINPANSDLIDSTSSGIMLSTNDSTNLLCNGLGNWIII